MLVGAAIGAVLGVDVLVDAIDRSPDWTETVVWPLLLIEGALVLGVLGLRMLRDKGT